MVLDLLRPWARKVELNEAWLERLADPALKLLDIILAEEVMGWRLAPMFKWAPAWLRFDQNLVRETWTGYWFTQVDIPPFELPKLERIDEDGKHQSTFFRGREWCPTRNLACVDVLRSKLGLHEFVLHFKPEPDRCRAELTSAGRTSGVIRPTQSWAMSEAVYKWFQAEDE